MSEGGGGVARLSGGMETRKYRTSPATYLSEFSFEGRGPCYSRLQEGSESPYPMCLVELRTTRLARLNMQMWAGGRDVRRQRASDGVVQSDMLEATWQVIQTWSVYESRLSGRRAAAVARSSTTRCSGRRQEVLLPPPGAVAAVLYTKEHGDLLLSVNGKTATAFSFTNRKMLHEKK